MVTHVLFTRWASSSICVTRFVGNLWVYELSSLPSSSSLMLFPSFFLTMRMLLQNDDGSSHSLMMPLSTYWSRISLTCGLTECGIGMYFWMCGSVEVMGIFILMSFAFPRSKGCLLKAFLCFLTSSFSWFCLLIGRWSISNCSSSSLSDDGFVSCRVISVSPALSSTCFVIEGWW